MEDNRTTKDLFLETLTKIGCQYKIDEEKDNRVLFAYQGEEFMADIVNNSYYVHLWDCFWDYVALNDLDDVARLRKAINTTNFNTHVTTVFSVHEDVKNIFVHSKKSIPFMASIPQIEEYLRVELDEFFHVHRVLQTEMYRLREKGA